MLHLPGTHMNTVTPPCPEPGVNKWFSSVQFSRSVERPVNKCQAWFQPRLLAWLH